MAEEVKFAKTVLKKNTHVVQTVDRASTVDPTTDPSKVCRAVEFLKSRGIEMVKGVYGAPISD